MSKLWPWALSGAIVILISAAVLMTNRCLFEEHRFLVAGIALGWFLCFIFFGKMIRSALLVVAIGAWLWYPRAEFTPSAEAGAMSTLRETAAALQNYTRNHRSEGYPAAIPTVTSGCRVRNVYEFRYSREKSPTSVADHFVLVAIPIRDSRGLRSFALTEDGHLYATEPNPQRPANRGDQRLQ